MRILIAPDGFKESMTAAQAARAMAVGAERAGRSANVPIVIDLCPIADGGEGTVDAMLAALNGVRRLSIVTGPVGKPVEAAWAEWTDNEGNPCALIEASSAAGLELIPRSDRNPERTTTFGVGQLVREAIGRGCARILIGLGGSGTVDGGAGLAQALGVRFRPEPRSPLTGWDLQSIERIEVTGRLCSNRAVDLGHARIIAMCDVDNPLLGQEGSARVFGPQKGATSAQVERLERALGHFAEVCRLAGLEADPRSPGAGAAGGLGFGLMALCGAELRPGAPLILEHVGFSNRARAADLVLTGEGRIDGQTRRGKAVWAVASTASEHRRPVFALAGSAGEGWETLTRADGGLLDGVRIITPGGVSLGEALRNGAVNLERATEAVVLERIRGASG